MEKEEKIIDSLSKLLNTYKNKLPDLNFINETVKVVKKEHNLNTLKAHIVSLIDFTGFKSLAVYNEINLKLEMYLITLLGNYLKIAFSYKDYLTKEEKKIFSKVYILSVILHECEHAYQYQISGNTSSLENKIISYSYDFVVDKNMTEEEKNKEEERLYKKLYDLEPLERFASIKSNLLLLKIINKINPDYKGLKYFIVNNLLVCCTNGYAENLSPLLSYLKGIGWTKEKIKEKFPWYRDNELETYENASKLYTLKERIYYGFPISDQEYEDLLKIHTLQKKVPHE